MKENETKKYPLTNDIIFKAVYGREDEACKKALVAMINVVLEREDEKIVSVEIKNPMNLQDNVTAKLSILDVKCKTDLGEIIGIEMQIKQRSDFEKRIVYYQAKKIGGSLNTAEEYATIKKVITISILVENLFKDVDKVHSIYRYKDIESGRELSEVSEIHFVELSKIDKNKEVAQMSVLERYGLYLLYANDDNNQDLVEAVKSYEDGVIEMTEPILNYVTAEEKIRQAASDREDFLWEQEIDKLEKRQAEEEKRQAEEEKRKAEEEKRKAEEEKRKAEEEKRKAEEEKRKAEEGKKQAEEDLERKQKSVIIKMKEKGASMEYISDVMEMTEEQIKQILQ